MKKVLLILVDGMRPDSLEKCGNPYAEKLISASIYAPNTQTVMPSVTLPCHMSLFHGVNPQRHGILSNTYTPQVRPIRGICEVLKQAKKNCAMFYNWEELKDLTRPDSLMTSVYMSGHIFGYEDANVRVTDAAIMSIQRDAPDFAFLYLGYTDAAGHDHGWMSEKYLNSVNQSFTCIEKIIASLPDDYVVFVTADHGGHDRSHGTDMPEDMTIPLIVYNRDMVHCVIDDTSILDIAPTITSLLGVEADKEWEGKVIDL